MLTLPDFPVRQRDFLLEISRAITARLELSEVLKRVLHASVVMVAGQVGLIALRSEEDGIFAVRAYAGISPDKVTPLNAHLADLFTGRETTPDYHYLNAKLSEMAVIIHDDLKQSIAMPLTFADKPLGLLIVFRSYQARITPGDMQILQSFADQAAIAVNNAQLYERINQERQRLAAILQYSGDGVMILDASLDIIQVNSAFEQITGWLSDQAMGQPVDEVLKWARIEQSDLRDAILQGFPRQKAPGSSPETFYVEGDLQRPDDLIVSIGITYAPLLNQDGRVTNYIASIRDISSFRRAQEMQNVFISTVSHELRTPVALIKGYASTLNRQDASWNMQVVHQSLQVIEEEADRLTELIDDLLTASKIQAERGVSLQMADVRLDVLGAGAVERQKTQTTRHEFILSFQELFPAIQGDARRLRQVIDNLITNAIKYSPNGGKITVGGRYSDHSVTFFVRDEGAGIPEAEQERIFERFYRVEGNLARKTKGTGLGLYLARAIIHAHKGTIAVKSTPGRGATFYFTIPRD
ncbi:MAG: ATP-binding protein [Anaerolineae bacterium]|jgi:PAS domain S-box-containing protein|nr:ATP-binding protein [Anaerolineae bacterium]